MQRHYKKILIVFRGGRETGRWSLTQTRVSTSESPIKRKIVQSSYQIHCQVLNEITKAKYLGITIYKTQTWNRHIDTVTKRANKTISFLQRYVSSCPKDIKEASYKTQVRPRLHVANEATVWGPATKTSINKVEAVQRSAAIFCQNDHRQTNSITSMIQNLGWDKLQYRHEQCKTVMMYQIVNNLIDIPAEKNLIHFGTKTRGHETIFLVP